MLKQKFGDCCIERTQPIKQKKQNYIKMQTPELKYALARYDTKD